MKKMDIFCASQASTAICLSTDTASSSSAASSTIQLGGKALDRHNPVIRGFTRAAGLTNPCVFQSPPIDPKPIHYRQLQKTKKNSSTKENDKKSKKIDSVPARRSFFEPREPKTDVIHRKSSFEVREKVVSNSSRKSWDLITPPGSTRYLLSDSASIPDPIESKENQAVNQNESSIVSIAEKPSKDQVVVLRVSLHCKGCEGKVRKHISRMEGVTSFTIDFAAKKVTIVGNVTPLEVLASVSKVKIAQFWTPPPPASSSVMG